AATWRAQVDRELYGADYERSLVRWTLDGIEQKPVYHQVTEAQRFGEPGQPPFRRGSRASCERSRPWQLCSRIDATSPEQANAEALDDLRGGADALWLVADRVTRMAGASARELQAAPNLEHDGIDFGGRSVWNRLLRGVQTELLALHLDAGVLAPILTVGLLDELEARGVASETSIHVGHDPLGSLARDGATPCSLEASWAAGWKVLARAADLPRMRVIRADGLPAHMAGASEAVEIGFMLASLTALLRAADRDDQSLEEVYARTDLRVGVGRDVFLEVAKIRALRELWSRVGELCEIEPKSAPFVHAVSSPRTLTQRDPWTNLLRSTTQGFAASVAGADAITLLPFDAALHRPGKLGRRMARNTQLVLAEEGHLGEIVDPVGGSFAIERWTDDLVEAGWAAFQEIEAQGGLTTALCSGWMADRLADTRELRARSFATREEAITGVSEYPQLDVPVPDPGEYSEADADSWQHGEGLPAAWVESLGALPSGEPVQADLLPFVRDAAPFEALRDTADAYAAEHGHAPRVCIVTLGMLAEHNPRTTFASNFFATGGFQSILIDEAEPGEAKGAIAVCICGTDAAYEELAPELVTGLRNAGADCVLLAGDPSALDAETQKALEHAELTDSLSLGCDAVALLQDLHRRLQAAAAASAGGEA
ncbi:MAG: methylmalonyl-CoA mutase family protein, partial [Planctomycetes bacterium]|nr:methylmalonyl-CoA mutase family protein [Planctomycetota bacterium]